MFDSLNLVLTLTAFAAYFAALAWALAHRGREFKGPWFFFLRAFLPNWRFYHAVGRPPRLYVRGMQASGQWTEWALWYPRRRRRWHHLLHNPDVNLALSQQNLVDHLASDINALNEGEDIRERVTYQLVSRLALEAVDPEVTAYQFQLRLPPPDGSREEQAVDCMLQSPIIRR
jgi:hypothetical protein